MQSKYNIIYEALNGDKSTSPKLDEPEIRRPIISNIRRCISKNREVLHNVDDYNVCKNSFDHFCVNLSLDNVSVIEYGSRNIETPLRKSQIYSRIKAIR